MVVPSSSLLQHLPERHQAERDPDPQDQSPINCLSSRPSCLLLLFPPHSSLSSHQNHVSNPESGPSGLYLFFPYSAGLPPAPTPHFPPLQNQHQLSRPPHLISPLQPLPIQMPLHCTTHSPRSAQCESNNPGSTGKHVKVFLTVNECLFTPPVWPLNEAQLCTITSAILN